MVVFDAKWGMSIVFLLWMKFNIDHPQSSCLQLPLGLLAMGHNATHRGTIMLQLRYSCSCSVFFSAFRGTGGDVVKPEEERGAATQLTE